jgi:hypothetical protein
LRQLRGWSLVAMAAVSVAVLFGAVAKAAPPEVQKNGIAYAKGHTAGHGPAGKALLLYHNGGVMTSGAAVTAIFWGTSWPSDVALGANGKVAGIDTFYGGVGGSAYLATNTEYTDASGTHVGTAVTYGGHAIDGSSAGSRDPGTSGVLAEVSKMIATPVANGYYPVYTDIPRGNAGYCAWHSWGTAKGVPVQFGFFFKLDGDAGCDPGDTSGLHSQGLAAIANVSGHELSEALTDPRGGGWLDRSGQENADKCAWTFHGLEQLSNGSKWLIQGNFSNAAYNARSGYDHAGCVNGNP